MNQPKARDTKRLNQSIVSWCFERYWDVEKMCLVAQQLGDTQEINYRAVSQAIAETGFAGYIGHEFMPTRDPLDGLREAVALCSV